MKYVCKGLFFPLALFLIGCQTTGQSFKEIQGHPFDIYLVQEEDTKKLSMFNPPIKLKKKSFTFIFYQKPYSSKKKEFNSVQMAVLNDQSLFDSVHFGMPLWDFKFLTPGSGMAASKDGYSDIIVSETGHHYIYYENETEKRAELVEELDNGYLKLAFSVDSFYYNKRSYPIKECPFKRLFFVFVIDRNRNGIIEPEELTKLEIVLDN